MSLKTNKVVFFHKQKIYFSENLFGGFFFNILDSKNYKLDNLQAWILLVMSIQHPCAGV